MNVRFRCQNNEIYFALPKHAKVFRSRPGEKNDDAYTAVIKNLLRPLGYKRSLFDLAKSCTTACLAFDVSCPPKLGQQMIDPILKTLHASGMEHKDIVILATAEYPASANEANLPANFFEKYRHYTIRFHDISSHKDHELVGKTLSGLPVYLDRRFKEADLKITAGGVYSNALFGFSGASLIVPLGLSGVETIRGLYDLFSISRLDDYRLQSQESLFYQELISLLKLARLNFIINIQPDQDMNISRIFSGRPVDVVKAMMELNHREAETLPDAANIVVAASGSSQCDSSFLHAFHSLGIANSYKKKGGWLVFATSLFDGLSGGQLAAIQDKRSLLQYFSGQSDIQSVHDKLLHFLDKTPIVFVSPQFAKMEQNKGQKGNIFFHAGIEQAVDFIKTAGQKAQDILVLPDALHTLPLPVS